MQSTTDSQPPSCPSPTLYFAYGSNLSLTQMRSRCPNSTYLHCAVLKNWRWVISSRGYANIVPSTSSGKGDKVYGLVYSLSLDGGDEESLDTAEGVPWAYEKVWAGVERIVEDGTGEVEGDGEEVVLVYVDPRGEKESSGQPREEYVGRMNRGIVEAMEKELPESYVEEVLRRFIPAS